MGQSRSEEARQAGDGSGVSSLPGEAFSSLPLLNEMRGSVQAPSLTSQAEQQSTLHETQCPLAVEEQLKQILHEVRSALAIIQLDVEVLERQWKTWNANGAERLPSSLQGGELHLDGEQAFLRQITHQVHQIRGLTTMIAEVVSPGSNPRSFPSSSL